MKQYKLIKEYPGSPKLGSIATFNNGNHLTARYNISLSKDSECIDYLEGTREVENHPEFWELIVEKDYEILSLIGSGSKLILTLVDNKYVGGNHDCIKHDKNTVNYLLSSGYNIHSVKRLSDGEIFTVGDNTTKGIVNKIFLQDPNGIGRDYPIAIEFNTSYENRCALNFRYLDGSNKGQLLLQKVKTPLFTTEDGVDIFEGNRFYYIVSGDTKFERGIGSLTAKPDVIGQCALARFSTREAAEKYILYNKPCFSINDILSSTKGLIFSERELEILAKSKL